jgi:hypothetical protein
MIYSICKRLAGILLIVFTIGLFFPSGPVAAEDAEFPQKNAWSRVTPSVVWCGDTTQTVTIEVHIVGRHDVAQAWVTNLGTSADEARAELFDDGSHGDAVSGDNVFTLGGVVLPCNPAYINSNGWMSWWGFLRVQLKDGSSEANNYGIVAGLVDPKYKNTFAVHDYGNGLSATAYAFFIVDDKHEVMSGYPVATVFCGTSNYQAYRKLYSVLPDDFDVALVTPGLQIVHPGDLAENVPYNVGVSNAIQHIGMAIRDNTAEFGSAGRLKSTVYESFGDIQIFDHEIGHTWGAELGASLGLLGNDPSSHHWNALADMQGQMGSYYFNASGAVGHFAFNGDGTWHLISNSDNEPYSPLELYMMGFIPPDEVPPIHILQSPNLTDPNHITAASYRTITIQDIMNAEGGARLPSAADSQKNYNVAYIVTQDTPYNDSAYAFFSLASYNLMTKDPPQKNNMYAPFYWATGGRGTLNTRLPVDVSDPLDLPGMPAPTPIAAPPVIPTTAPPATKTSAAPPTSMATRTSMAGATVVPATPTKTSSNGSRCATAPVALVIAAVGLSLRPWRRKPN